MTRSVALTYFEDFEIGQRITVREHVVLKDEVVAFAAKWDPQPFHVDEEAARASGFGGLVACSSHIMAICIRLLNEEEVRANVLAGLGWDEVRFPNPVRPGDSLMLTVECVDTRESRSKPDRGIVRNRVTVRNQKDELVATFEDMIIVAKRKH